MELARIELEKTVEFLTGRILAIGRQRDALTEEQRELSSYQEHLIRQVERMRPEVCAECDGTDEILKTDIDKEPGRGEMMTLQPCPSCQGGSDDS